MLASIRQHRLQILSEIGIETVVPCNQFIELPARAYILVFEQMCLPRLDRADRRFDDLFLDPGQDIFSALKKLGDHREPLVLE